MEHHAFSRARIPDSVTYNKYWTTCTRSSEGSFSLLAPKHFSLPVSQRRKPIDHEMVSKRRRANNKPPIKALSKQSTQATSLQCGLLNAFYFTFYFFLLHRQAWQATAIRTIRRSRWKSTLPSLAKPELGLWAKIRTFSPHHRLPKSQRRRSANESRERVWQEVELQKNVHQRRSRKLQRNRPPKVKCSNTDPKSAPTPSANMKLTKTQGSLPQKKNGSRGSLPTSGVGARPNAKHHANK